MVATTDAPATGAADQTSRKDVFVSYSHRDARWVREFLVPALEAAKFTVHIDYRDFLSGVPNPDLMANAVENCRHTLAIISPGWVESQWATFEGRRALSSGIKDRKLIPLYLQDCQLPNWLTDIGYVDFRDAHGRDQAWSKLLNDLKATPEQYREASLKTGQLLADLKELLRRPEAKVVVRKCRQALELIREQLNEVERFKHLHDAFHKSFPTYGRIHELRRQLPSVEGWLELDLHVIQLREDASFICKVARENFAPSEVLWCDKLELLTEGIINAVRAQDAAAVVETLTRLDVIFGQQPSLLDLRLVDAARKLPLTQLQKTLKEIELRLSGLTLPMDDVKLLEQFDASLDSLERLEQVLTVMVNNHNCLQEMYDQLRTPEFAAVLLSPMKIIEQWQWLQCAYRMINSEIKAPHIERVLSVGDALDKCLAEKDVEFAENGPQRMRQAFSMFRSVVKTAFDSADLELVKYCGNLSEIGDKLKDIVWSMESDE